MTTDGDARSVAVSPGTALPVMAWFVVLLPWLPVLLWRMLPDTAVMITSPTAALRALGLHAGLLGYVAFATSLVLGMRVPVVERLFGGVDRMYRFHRRLGATVAALLAVHVLAMLGAQAAADQPVGALLRPDPGWRVFAGVVGLGASPHCCR